MESPKSIFIHDDWNHLTTNYDADVSLLKFEDRSINFNVFVQPICLWNSEAEPTVTKGIVTGWGKTEDLTKVHQNIPKRVKALIETNEQCFLNTKALVDLSSFRTFCAGLRNGSGVCHGDSGGGLFIKVDGRYYLKGIVSSSLIKDGNCHVTRNAVYTNIFKFREWIEEIIEDQTTQRTTATTQNTAVFSASLLKFTTKIPPSRPTKILKKEKYNFTGLFTEVSCTFKRMGFWKHGNFNTCVVNQNISNEAYILSAPEIQPNMSVEQFHIPRNKEVKFLPIAIGIYFPKLNVLWVRHCALSVVRNFTFNKMFMLQYLILSYNEIVSVEKDAFQDLVSLKWLNLEGNMIGTLDGNLFFKMLKLSWIYLNNNRIEFLKPATFQVPGGELMNVNLRENLCIDRIYLSENLNQLESDLRTNCTVIFL